MTRGTKRYSRRKTSFLSRGQVLGILFCTLAAVAACCWFALSVNGQKEERGGLAESSQEAWPLETQSAQETGSEEESTGDKDEALLEKETQSAEQPAVSRESLKGETAVTRVMPEEPEPATLFDEQYMSMDLDAKLTVLREKFPDGKYWNTIGYDVSDLTQEEACMIVTDEPCNHGWNGYEYCHEYDGRTLDEYTYDYNIQCLGFASMVSDFLFGKDAEIETFYDFEELDVGDQIRFLAYEHSVVVIEKGPDYVKVVECNRDYENCEIEWGRELSEDEVLYGWADYEFLRRVD